MYFVFLHSSLDATIKSPVTQIFTFYVDMDFGLRLFILDGFWSWMRMITLLNVFICIGVLLARHIFLPFADRSHWYLFTHVTNSSGKEFSSLGWNKNTRVLIVVECIYNKNQSSFFYIYCLCDGNFFVKLPMNK